MHKAFVKANFHEVSLSEYSNFYAQYDILPGQRACMKCLRRVRDSDFEYNVPKGNVNEICESDVDMEKVRYSLKQLVIL